jgi:hypothetical protein
LGNAAGRDAIVRLNRAFEPTTSIKALVGEGLLHPGSGRVFRRGKDATPGGEPLRLRQRRGVPDHWP